MFWAFRVVVVYCICMSESGNMLLGDRAQLWRQISAVYVGCLLQYDCYDIRDNCYIIIFKLIFRTEEQPVCSYLEKILSKNMELMEKKLMDYIDQRIYKLQEHIDNKIALLVDLLQNPSSPPSGMPLRHYDSGERLSNGER